MLGAWVNRAAHLAGVAQAVQCQSSAFMCHMGSGRSLSAETRAGPLPGVAPSAHATGCRGPVGASVASRARQTARSTPLAPLERRACAWSLMIKDASPPAPSPRARPHMIENARHLAFSCQSSAFTRQLAPSSGAQAQAGLALQRGRAPVLARNLNRNCCLRPCRHSFVQTGSALPVVNLSEKWSHPGLRRGHAFRGSRARRAPGVARAGLRRAAR